jgi:transmembrane secretion effector
MSQQAEQKAEPSRKRSLFRPLRVRNFRLLWLGETVSILGDQFYLVALTWLVLQLTGSDLAVGTVLMAASIPRAVFMLVGGAFSDRLSPRFLMLASNVLRAGLTVLLTVLVVTRVVHLWHVYVISVAFGTVDAFFYPAFRTLIPKMLEPTMLEAGNSLIQGSFQLTLLAGPAPAGFLIAAVGVSAALGIDAATFVFSVLMLWLIRIEGGTTSAATARATSGVLSSIREGLGYSWGDPVIRAILLMIAAINFSFFGPFIVGLASLADKRFAGGPVAYGTMFSAWGAGALVGTLIAGWVGRVRRRGLVFIAMTTGLGVGLILLGVIQSLALASVVISLMSLGSGFVNIGMLSWLQTRTEPAMLGRVMSVLMFAAVGLAPFSYVIAGAMAALNPVIMFASAGGIILLSAATALSSKHLRTMD